MAHPLLRNVTSQEVSKLLRTSTNVAEFGGDPQRLATEILWLRTAMAMAMLGNGHDLSGKELAIIRASQPRRRLR
jgi:hypothetical protein